MTQIQQPVQITRPLFVKAKNPRGCGEPEHYEYVNINHITRIYPNENGTATIFYETNNSDGGRRNCTASLDKKELNHLNIIV